jgi:molybdate transport system ATP-binding protein
MNRFHLRARYASFELDASAAWEAPAAALFGASGSGKTTIVEALAGLRPEVAGEVTLRDRRLDDLPARRRRVGWVPQDASLFPRMSARENVDFAVGVGGDAGAARRAIEFLEIGPILERRATDLSGGERQRVAIARALASRPEFLLLDEPLAAIDRPLRGRIVPYLARLPAETGVPMLLVTHDPLEVAVLAQHVVVVASGRAVAAGAPQEIFDSAATLGALAAIGAENRFEVTVGATRPGTFEVVTSGGNALVMTRVAGFPPPRRVAVRAEDVLLAAARPELVSAQNVFPATLKRLAPIGEQVLVELAAAGDRWIVKVTRRAVEQLRLAPGLEVWLLIKAHAIVAES